MIFLEATNEWRSFINIGLGPLLFVIGDTRSFVSHVTVFLIFFPSLFHIFFFLFYSPSASLHFLKNINSVDDDFFSMTDSFIHWGNRKNHDGSTPAETPKIVNEPTHFNYFYRSLDSISNFNSNLNQLIIKVNKFNHQFKSMKWNSFKYLEWIRLNRFISFRDCVNNFPPLSHYDRYQNYNLRSSFIYLFIFFE